MTESSNKAQATLEQRKAMLVNAIRQAQAMQGEDTDSALESLDTTGRWYIKVFATLSKTRATERPLQPIPLEEMTAYLETQDIPVEPDEFIEAIQAMDRAWMAIQTAR